MVILFHPNMENMLDKMNIQAGTNTMVRVLERLRKRMDQALALE
jgi:hypothetical protein